MKREKMKEIKIDQNGKEEGIIQFQKKDIYSKQVHLENHSFKSFQNESDRERYKRRIISRWNRE